MTDNDWTAKDIAGYVEVLSEYLEWASKNEDLPETEEIRSIINERFMKGSEMPNNAQKVLDSRNCYHVNDYFNIVYCAFDDRGNCRSEFHAESPEALYDMIVNSDENDMAIYTVQFLTQYNKVQREKKASAIRSAQIAASIRGDRAEDIRLFNEWLNIKYN